MQAGVGQGWPDGRPETPQRGEHALPRGWFAQPGVISSGSLSRTAAAGYTTSHRRWSRGHGPRPSRWTASRASASWFASTRSTRAGDEGLVVTTAQITLTDYHRGRLAWPAAAHGRVSPRPRQPERSPRLDHRYPALRHADSSGGGLRPFT